MKRFKFLLVVLLLLIASQAWAVQTVYIKTSLTGGGSSALDGIDGATLLDKDMAFVTVGSNMYMYWLDADSGLTDDGLAVIAPDSNAGTKRWILQYFYAKTLQVDGHSSQTLTVAQVSGTIIYNVGQGANDITLTLPDAVAGLSFILTVGEAQSNKWRIRAGTSNYLYFDGTKGSLNGYVKVATPTIGNYLTCFSFKSGSSTYDWICRTGSGTWAAE